MLLSASDLERYGQIKEKNKSFHFLILGKKNQQRLNNTTIKVQDENQIKHTDNTFIMDCLISFCDII